ncbi:MAG: hypothetical protein E4H10_06005 [Bacteroidia bacterium]|nr:MAG: hypothetical protein E4H10_06005 [Bacteroidia bacterium]
MKRALYVLIIFSVSISSYCQVSGIIHDVHSMKTIPYANIAVYNSSDGTSSNQDGGFYLANVSYGDTIVISAVGYEKTFHRLKKDSFILYLTPKHYQIPELEVAYNSTSSVRLIEPFKKKSATAYYVCYSSPWMNGRVFNYKSEYSQTPFIKEIHVLTKSRIDGAKFNLRLMSVSNSGTPDEDLLTENLIVKVPKGTNKSSIDISRYKLQFPRSGICIALEWLTIDENIYYSRRKSSGSAMTKKSRIEPKFAVLELNEKSNSWTYLGGKWHNNSELGGPTSKFDLALEIVLTK